MPNQCITHTACMHTKHMEQEDILLYFFSRPLHCAVELSLDRVESLP